MFFYVVSYTKRHLTATETTWSLFLKLSVKTENKMKF